MYQFFNKRTNVAFGLIYLLGEQGDTPKRLADLAPQLGVSKLFLEQIAGKLKRAGLIRTKKGPGGGAIRALEHVSVKNVIDAVEPTTKNAKINTLISHNINIDLHDYVSRILIGQDKKVGIEVSYADSVVETAC